MRRINERGEIVNDASSSNPQAYSSSYSLGPSAEQRSRFLATTLIASPIIYSIVSVILNVLLKLYLEPFFAFIVGGVFGIIVTAIYDFAYAKQYDTKEYVLGFTLPGIVLIAIVIGIAILAVLLILFVLAGLVSGGG